MRWILTSFCTEKTPYEKFASRFKRSAIEADLPELVVDIVPNLRDWHKNTRLKAKCIRKNLDTLEGLYEALVFVDIDAIFHSYPILFDNLDCEFAAYFRNWRHARNELLSGTLYFKICEKTKSLVDEWIELNRQNPNIWEQKNLQRALKRFSSIYYLHLPIEYCTIFDDPDRKKIKPVIEHYQASRKFRYEVAK